MPLSYSPPVSHLATPAEAAGVQVEEDLESELGREQGDKVDVQDLAKQLARERALARVGARQNPVQQQPLCLCVGRRVDRPHALQPLPRRLRRACIHLVTDRSGRQEQDVTRATREGGSVKRRPGAQRRSEQGQLREAVAAR